MSQNEKIALTKPADGSHQDVMPSLLPMFHVFGLTTTLAKLVDGCKIIMLPKFSPDLFLDSLQKYKATVLYIVPPIGKCLE
jgi:4-coumarate--CoA ligase